MKLEFYNLESGEPYSVDGNYFFVDAWGEVYCDNGESYESQSATIDFEAFVTLRADVGWRVFK